MTPSEIAAAIHVAKSVASRYRLHTVIAGSLQDDANTIAIALLALHAEVERMRPVFEASIDLRVADSDQPLGDSIAELTAAAEIAVARTQRALMRWRNAIDTARQGAAR